MYKRQAYAYVDQYDNVLPIWGIQKKEELEQFLSFIKEPPAMTEPIRAMIEQDRKLLSGSFCRGCGYCMPCPAGIKINDCARTVSYTHLDVYKRQLQLLCRQFCRRMLPGTEP